MTHKSNKNFNVYKKMHDLKKLSLHEIKTKISIQKYKILFDGIYYLKIHFMLRN